MAIYINGNYTPNNYDSGIRSYCGKKKTKDFLIKKYRRRKSTISNIEWDLQANFIKKKPILERKA